MALARAATPPVLAMDVWELLPDGVRRELSPSEPVALCCRRLAMGMAHNVQILMLIVWHQVAMMLDVGRQLAER